MNSEQERQSRLNFLADIRLFNAHRGLCSVFIIDDASDDYAIARQPMEIAG